ncbi:MAG: citramalate synthase [Candidatus Aureabacteria bacterium]|nr:citramalate synthase [Candidatus Auribacterota bacterium]
MKSRSISLYDTTLRDGSQGLGVSFSVADKIQIARQLDSLGIHYIEGGWPGSNPKDEAFFEQISRTPLKQAKIAAFGSTRRANTKVEKDDNVLKLLKVETPVVTIFGKSWSFHVSDILKVSYEDNLKMITDSVAFLKKAGREVFFDAEHFFDGYRENPDYAIQTLNAAAAAGADCLVLCDTNGGTMPSEIQRIFNEVKSCVTASLGIHTHNDSGVAVANSLIAVDCGAVLVQGTINGFGERTGNADLCSILPNLQLKGGHEIVSPKQLARLLDVSRMVDDLANVRHNPRLPYVGEAAFAHKAGIHVNAVQKNQRAYEHVKPESIGADRLILVSELSGQSNILMKAKEFGINLDKNDPKTKDILTKLKEKEHRGYEYESAEASFEVLMMKILGTHKSFFDLHAYRVIIENRDNKLITEATIKLTVKGKMMYLAAEGDGPVNALDAALRNSLEPFYPVLSQVKLADFKVRVLEGDAGTDARVRVIIESTDNKTIWGTVGVSENIIEACLEALIDSIEYKLFKK